MRVVLAALVLVVACGGKSKGGAAPAEATCDDAAKGLSKILAGDADAQDVPQDLITAEKQAMKPIFVDVCTADAWTPEIMACYAGVADIAAVGKCSKALTDDQKLHLTTALDDAAVAASHAEASSDADE